MKNANLLGLAWDEANVPAFVCLVVSLAFVVCFFAFAFEVFAVFVGAPFCVDSTFGCIEREDEVFEQSVADAADD